jgi:hypothetical protein
MKRKPKPNEPSLRDKPPRRSSSRLDLDVLPFTNFVALDDVG